MTRHFEALTLRPILRHQLTKQSRLLWRFSQSAAEFISIKSFISSAKHKSLHKGKALRTLLTNSKNRIGDKCPPWGTPDVDEKIFDLMPNNFTHCSLFTKKEPNQESKGSPKPDVSRILNSERSDEFIDLTFICVFVSEDDIWRSSSILRRKQWQLHRRPEDRQNLNFLTRKVKTLLAELRIDSYQKYLSTIHPADSNLWLATKRLIKPNNNKIPPLKSGNIFINTVNEKCNLFATTLANTFAPNSHNDDATNLLVSQKLSEAEIFPQNIFPYTNPSELSEIIKKLPYRKSPGHDLITNSILKKLPNKAVVFMTVLFNALLKLSYFPTAWKKAKIIMIKKPGKDNTDPKNYRPISLLSSVSKIFEKIIHSRLINHLNATEAIPHCQFGFKPNHSTTQQLLRITEHIRNGFEKKEHTGAAFLDIANAFDKIWHDGLLYKLKCLNTPTVIFNIIRSFL
ncbi:hypothetical protein QTP88_004643 [Uroleucon formosanum]